MIEGELTTEVLEADSTPVAFHVVHKHPKYRAEGLLEIVHKESLERAMRAVADVATTELSHLVCLWLLGHLVVVYIPE